MDNFSKNTSRRRIYSIPTEFSEQKALVEWLNYKNIIFYHIPNGGYRNAKEGAKFSLIGVKPGVPDICIPHARKPYHGIYLELKRRMGGSVSKNQKEWIEKLWLEGYRCEVVKGWEEGVKAVEHYFMLERW